MFRPRPKNKVSVKIKGWLATPIQYEVRNPTGDWTPFLSTFQDQRFGRWDSDSCWMLGGAITPCEAQMNWLWANGMFSQEAKDFFMSNGYLDGSGKFAFSERFHEILCGNKDQGGTAAEGWQSLQKRGIIPRPMLTYTVERSNQWNTQQDFDNDYFSISNVTPAMILLGQQSLEYVRFAYQTIGKNWTIPTPDIFRETLKQAPLSIGIPIPINVFNWNNSFVQYDGATTVAHEVCNISLSPNNEYNIDDQYNPFRKTLSADYYIPIITQGIVYPITQVSANPIPQPSNVSFWTALENWWNSAFGSFVFNN